MKERSFDEMIAYFNRRVAEMDIAEDYKMELLGMVTALGYKHEKTTPQWISCSERLPENDDWQIVTVCDESADRPYIYSDFGWYLEAADCWIVDADQRRDITAWMPLPESYKGEKE